MRALQKAEQEGVVVVPALARYDELCEPYKTVINIDPSKLPTAEAVSSWSSQEYIDALRHDQSFEAFNVHFRQLVHVAYKVAAEMGKRYSGLLRECRKEIEENVTFNLYERHLRPLFLGKESRNKAGTTPRISEAQTQ